MAEEYGALGREMLDEQRDTLPGLCSSHERWREVALRFTP